MKSRCNPACGLGCNIKVSQKGFDLRMASNFHNLGMRLTRSDHPRRGGVTTVMKPKIFNIRESASSYPSVFYRINYSENRMILAFGRDFP